MQRFLSCLLLFAFLFPVGGRVKTSPIILFGTNALAIRDDIASITASDIQPFVDLDDLKTEIAQNKWITFEPDTWLLDGNYHFMPAQPHAGYISASMSDDQGILDPGPTLTITFNSVHSTTNGLTLRGSQLTGDWVNLYRIKFYDSSNVLIDDHSYNPSTWEFSTGQAVADFKKIVIEFDNTNKAYRFARLSGIDFDTVIRFTGADVIEARLVESINPLSIELPYNTLDLTLFSDDADFSIVAPAGFYATLQENQPLDVYEAVDTDVIYIGRYYLDEWESKSETVAVFRTVDAIGVLDKTPLSKEMVSTTFGDIDIDYLFVHGDTGFDYENDGYTETTVRGWLQNPSVREELQQILFSGGGYATCARGKVIKIKPFVLASDLVSFDYTLTASDKGIESPVETRRMVTGVEVKPNPYLFDEAYMIDVTVKGTFGVGAHVVLIDSPFYSLTSITGATLTSADSSYIEFSVASPGAVTIVYQAVPKLAGVEASSVYTSPAPSTQNVLQFSPALATAFPETSATATAQRVYDYYQQRYIQKTKIFAFTGAVGDSVLIDTQSGKQIAGIIERMTTDLARGFVSDVEIYGVVVP